MNNLKTYYEFINEEFKLINDEDFSKKIETIKKEEDPEKSLYDTINSETNPLYWGGSVFLSFISLIAFSTAFGGSYLEKKILIATALTLNVPLLLLMGKSLVKYLFNMLRSKFLLKRTYKKYNDMKDIIKKYPDLSNKLEKNMNQLKIELELRNYNEISRCIHNIYNMSNELAKREGYEVEKKEWTEIEEKSDVFNLNKILDILEKKRMEEELKEILNSVKKKIIIYEQTDNYPDNFLLVKDVDEKSLIELQKLGFGVYQEKDDKYRILWKWR